MGSGELIFSQCAFDASVHAAALALTTLSAGSCSIAVNLNRIVARPGHTFSAAWVGCQIVPVVPDGNVGPLNICAVTAVAPDGSSLDMAKAASADFDLAFTVSPNPIVNPILWSPISLAGGGYSAPSANSPRLSMNHCDVHAGLPPGFGYGVQAAAWVGVAGSAGNPSDGVDRGIRYCRVWDSVNDPVDLLGGLYERCYSRGGSMGKGGHVDGIQPGGVQGADANPLIIRNNHIDNRRRRIDSLDNVMGGVLTDGLGNAVIGAAAPTSGINGGIFFDPNDSIYSDTSVSAYGNVIRGGTFTLVVKNLTQGVTFAAANPTVVTYGGLHHLRVGDPVVFKLAPGSGSNTITGVMPSGLTPYRVYWVVAVPTPSTMQIAASKGGAPIDLTGASSLGTGIIMSAPVKALQAYHDNLVAEGLGGSTSLDTFRNGPRWVATYNNTGLFSQAADPVAVNSPPTALPIRAIAPVSPSGLGFDFDGRATNASASLDNDGLAVGTPSAGQTNPYGYEYQVQPAGTALSPTGWLAVPYGALGPNPDDDTLTRVTLSGLTSSTAYAVGLRAVNGYTDPDCVALQHGAPATATLTMPDANALYAIAKPMFGGRTVVGGTPFSGVSRGTYTNAGGFALTCSYQLYRDGVLVGTIPDPFTTPYAPVAADAGHRLQIAEIASGGGFTSPPNTSARTAVVNPGYDTDALAYFNALGAQPSDAHKNRVDALVKSGKAKGWWANLSCLIPLGGGSLAASNADLKTPSGPALTLYGSDTTKAVFMAQGFIGGGTSLLGFAATGGFKPQTAAHNSIGLSTFLPLDATGNPIANGAAGFSFGNVKWALSLFQGSGLCAAQIASSTLQAAIPNPTTAEHHVVAQREGGTDGAANIRFYEDGAFATAAASAVGTLNINAEVMIGGYQTSTTAGTWSGFAYTTRGIALVHASDNLHLTPQNVADLCADIAAYKAAPLA